MEININCDLGEKSKFHSIENDPKLLSIVNSANVACGYHAGDEATDTPTILPGIDLLYSSFVAKNAA